MSGEWFYVENGQHKGPVTHEELRERAVRGDLERPDLVWTEGMVEWQRAGTVVGLFEGVEASPYSYREPAAQGGPYHGPYASPAQMGTPGIVIAGFILSICGIFVCAIVGVLGMVLSIIGLKEAKRRQAGVGLAIAGIVLGGIGVLLMVVMLVFWIIVASSGSW